MEPYPLNVGSKFNLMRQDGVMIDVIIKCGGKEFPAHKLVLAGGSPYFQAMLTSQMKESQAKEIEIPSDDPDTMMRVLEYMYTQSIDITKNTRSVIGIAEYLQIDFLSRACCEYLLTPESLSKAFESWDILDLYQKDQSVTVLNYLSSRLPEVYAMKEFLELSQNRVEQLIKKYGEIDAVGTDNVSTINDIKLQSVINWIKYDLENRKTLLPEMINHFDLSTVSCKYLINVMENETWITQIPTAATKFLTKITSHLWERKQITTILNFVAENSMEIHNLRFNDNLSYELLPKSEITIHNFKSSDVLHVFSDKCKIFFLTSSFNIHVYNLETSLWGEVVIDKSPFTPSVPILSCIISKGFLFVLTEEKFIQYDTNNSFEMREKTRPVISSVIQKETLVEISDKLYCIGGKKYLQEFDLSSNKWHQVDFKSQSKFVASLKTKPFFVYSQNSELYILTKDMLHLFIVSIPNNRFLTIRGVNLPNPIKQATWLSFNVYSLSPKNNHFKFYLLDNEGNMWMRITEGNFETWIKDKEIIPLNHKSTSSSVFLVNASIHI